MPRWIEETRICAHCGAEFLPEAPNQKYCSLQCKQTVENARWYEANREARIQRSKEDRKKRQERRKRLAEIMSIEGKRWMDQQLVSGKSQIDIFSVDMPEIWKAYLPADTPESDYQTARDAWMKGVNLAVKAWQIEKLK